MRLMVEFLCFTREDAEKHLLKKKMNVGIKETSIF